VQGGSSTASQDASNKASADSSNHSNTSQDATATQTGGSVSCYSGCGGGGQEQNVDQSALTKQNANSDAKAKQNAVNANVPLGITGYDVSGGSDPSADQTATNKADADSSNKSKTDQSATATQTAGDSHCFSGCGGNSQEQNVIQDGKTKQNADSDAKAKQNAVNGDSPVLAVGGDPSGDSSSATQDASNKANADASNKSKTDQSATATQTGGDSWCISGCGGNGQEQNVAQIGETKQNADANAKAKQNADNADTPVSILGIGLSGSDPSSADQTASNKADADASNKSKTTQDATATQTAGDSHCFSGCGGNSQEQNVLQVGKTKQNADADAKAKQDALNANAPALVVGGDPSGGSSSATQDASNKADADASNKSKTDQSATATQTAGDSWCFSGCGGNGQEQNVAQIGKTKQDADANAIAKQNAVNADTPASILGGGLSGSDPSADQTASNKADADASNKSKTSQDATATQTGGSSWCWSGCGGNGQEQNVFQLGETKQSADADAKAKQKALNANAPLSIVGGDPSADPSSATQDASNKANADARNKSKTDQSATPTQTAGDSHCYSGCGANGQEQDVAQIGKTKQRSDSNAKAKQKALNANTPVNVFGDSNPYAKRGVMTE
jgi:hypothetical protein